MNREEKLTQLESDRERFCEIIKEKLEIYKLTSKPDECYVIWDKTNQEFEITSTPRNTSSSIQIKLRKWGHMFLVFERRHIMPTLMENNLIEEVFDIGFKPTEDKTYELENKIYLNTFKKGEFECKFKISKNKISLSEGLKKHNFPQLMLLFRHLVGDERVFYQENIILFKEKNNLNDNEELDFEEFIDKLKTKEIDTFKHHFNNKFEELSNNEEYKDIISKKISYFLKWIAFIIQNPDFKLPNGLVFQSTPGVGKDRLIEWVLIRIFGVNNIKSIGQDDIGKYNDFVEGMRFVICNELEFNRSNTAMYNQIKRLMTNRYIAVQGKFKAIKNIINFAHFLFFGNAENMMRIEKGDRRFSVFKQDLKLPKTISRALSPELNPGYLEKELDQLTQFLYELEVSFEEIERPLITEEKEEIMNYHKSDIDSFIDDMKEYSSLEHAVKNLTASPEEIRYFKPFFALYENEEILQFEKELLPNDVVFRLFLLNNKHKQINSTRQNNSFQKALTKKGLKSTESMYNNILGVNQRHRFLFEIFPNAKDLIQEQSSEVEVIDMSKTENVKEGIEQ